MIPDPTAQPAHRTKKRRRVLLLLVLPAVGLLALELCYRGYLALRGAPYSRARTEESLVRQLTTLENGIPRGDLDEATTGAGEEHWVLHPYFGFWPRDDFDRMAQIAAYYRTPESEKTYDILLLGGSVAAGYAGRVQRLLPPLLAGAPGVQGRAIRVHGFGCPGFKEPQPLVILSVMLAMGHRPDAVIVLDGYNEIAVASENAHRGAHPVFPSWAHMMDIVKGGLTDPRTLDTWIETETLRREAQRDFDWARRWKLTSSAVLGRIVEMRLERLCADARSGIVRLRDELAQQRLPLTVKGPRYEAGPPRLLEDCIQAWTEGARGIQALCRANGIHALHVLQPCRDDPGAKPLSASERAGAGKSDWDRDIQAGYPKLREAAAQLAREGLNVLDATRVFEKTEEEIYFDGCHFGEHGYILLSRFIAPVFVSTMPAPRPAGNR